MLKMGSGLISRLTRIFLIGFIFLGFADRGAWAAAVRAKGTFSVQLLFTQYCQSIFFRCLDRYSRKYFSQTRRIVAQSDPYVGDQMRLLQDILEQYDPRIRPVRRPLQPVNITVRMNLYQIVEVEERTQHVAIYAWMTQSKP